MKMYKLNTSHWYMERLIFLLAGLILISSVLLVLFVSTKFLILTALVGAMQIVFAISGLCPMAILLHNLGIHEKTTRNN